MNKKLSYKPKYRRNLPHIQPPGVTLFVTFQLAGSLPDKVIRQLQIEKECNMEMISRMADPRQRDEMVYFEHRRHFGRWDDALNQNTKGPFWLREYKIAKLVSDDFHSYDNVRFSLICLNIMPNHVHAVFTPLKKENRGYWPLSAIMHSIKGYSAREANKILGRAGKFWHKESFDHVVRDEEELNRIVRYVLNNPVKAGFVKKWDEWKWSYCKFGTI